MRDDEWQTGQTELEDLELKDSSGDCGLTAREVRACADGGGAAGG